MVRVEGTCALFIQGSIGRLNGCKFFYMRSSMAVLGILVFACLSLTVERFDLRSMRVGLERHITAQAIIVMPHA